MNIFYQSSNLTKLYFRRIRDIHLALRGINGKVKKEFGVEVKWDANRDPGQKAVLSVEMHRPKPSAVDYEFVLTYPGRTVTGSLGMKSTGMLNHTCIFIKYTHVAACAYSNPTNILQFQHKIILSFKMLN